MVTETLSDIEMSDHVSHTKHCNNFNVEHSPKMKLTTHWNEYTYWKEGFF